jgi:hypothetical protein
MRRYVAVATGLFIAGCASTPDTTPTAQKPMEEKEYRVGSRIPVKDPVGSSPTGTVDPAAMRTGAPRTN